MAKTTKKAQTIESDLKIKAAFDLKSETVKKLKHIAAYDDHFQNEILEEVLEKYFSDWEKANHKIPIKR